jgi:exopolysaccharide production protein ExoY
VVVTAVTAAERAAGPRETTLPRDYATRRIFDITGALLLLVLSAPLLLLGAALVLAGSGLPIVFGHVRVGQNGKRFRCWKLRTMKRGAELHLVENPELAARHARNGYKLPAHEDPRVTRVGRMLRRTHIDELPQLFNVLFGDMSLVGPRPVIEAELEQFGEDTDILLCAQPGIFGAWTSLGRKRPPYPARAHIELKYVLRRSLRGDLRILLRSIPVVFQGQSS